MHKQIKPIREVADFIIRQLKGCNRMSQISILRDLANHTLFSKYVGDPLLAHEYIRVEIELTRKELELYPNQIEIEAFCEN